MLQAQPERKMPEQNMASPEMTIHFRLSISLARPDGMAQRPYVIVNTVPTNPMLKESTLKSP